MSILASVTYQFDYYSFLFCSLFKCVLAFVGPLHFLKILVDFEGFPKKAVGILIIIALNYKCFRKESSLQFIFLQFWPFQYFNIMYFSFHFGL